MAGVSSCVCNLLAERSRGGCHVDGPPSRRLDPAAPDGSSPANGCVRGMEGPRVPRPPGPALGGSEQPRGAEDVLPAWWLFSSSTPGVAGVGGRPWKREGCAPVFPLPAPPLLASCVISSPGFERLNLVDIVLLM